MRYIVILFWTLILGLVAGFLGAKLTMSAFALVPTLFASIVVAVVVILLDKIAIPSPKKEA